MNEAFFPDFIFVLISSIIITALLLRKKPNLCNHCHGYGRELGETKKCPACGGSGRQR